MSGYAYVWKPGDNGQRGKRVKRANLVLEEKLGRSLEANEIAHHKNNNRADDSPDNLEIKDFVEHSRDHANAVRYSGPNLERNPIRDDG